MQVFDFNGRFVRQLNETMSAWRLRGPYGIAIDRAGNFIVVGFSNCVQIMKPNGEIITVFDVSNPSTVCVDREAEFWSLDTASLCVCLASKSEFARSVLFDLSSLMVVFVTSFALQM